MTFAAADLSYRFVETPVRRLGFGGAFAALTRRMRSVGTRRARIAWSVVVAASLAVAVVLATAPDRTATEELITANEAALARSAAATSAAPSPAPSAGPSASATRSPAAPASWAMPEGSEIDAFGDSMLVGAKQAMEYYFPKVRLDARSNRRWSQAPALVQARGDGLRRAVVLAFGTNFGTDEQAIERTLEAVGPDRMVVVLTVHGRYARAETDNETLRAVVRGHDNVVVADWDAALADTRGMLQSDGIHPSIRGAHLYSATVRAAFAELSERRTGTAVPLTPIPLP